MLTCVLRHGLMCCLLGFFVGVGSADAQNRSLLEFYKQDRPRLTRESMNRLAERARNQEELAQQPLTPLAPLEGAVDADVYLVGPNDIFSVSVGGVEPVQVQVPITSDGFLPLPTVGPVLAAGRTLNEVREAALAALRENFRNVPVDVALVQPREFYVHITGAVPEPGRYRALPVARVEDVLKLAFFSQSFEEPVQNPLYRPGLRNVRITHKNGEVNSIDLVAYYRAGRTESNPYMQDGDAVNVPAFRPTQQGLFISGEVAFPGTFDYRPGDTLLDVLRLAAGPGALTYLQTVRLTRRTPDGSTQATVYQVADLLAGQGENPALQPLDNIHIPEPEREIGMVEADGYVRHPGTYAIEEGRTTLRELVEMVGGLRPEALLRGAYLERGVMKESRTVADVLLDPQTTRVLPFVTDTSAALQQSRLGTLDFLSRNYLLRALEMENRVSIDMTRALEDGANPVVLFGGDRLVVPRDEQSVRVIGEVVRPGAVAFQVGLSAEGYVSAAGGRGPKATSAYIIRAGSGQLINAENAPVFSGDLVFVDREGGDPITSDHERLLLQKKDAGIRRYQVGLQTVGTILSIITTTLLVRNAIKN